MSELTLDAIRDVLDSDVPAKIATCDAQGMPNVSNVSEVHYVDGEHLALSFQFFNKTRANVLANPRAIVMIADRQRVARYRLSLAYVRTETEGPLFETMKARLAGIASHTGMGGVFRLRGSDVYRVLAIEYVPGCERPPSPPRPNLLARLRSCSEVLGAATDLGKLFDETLAALAMLCRAEHALVLMADEPHRRLYTVASRGYAQSGVGAEIAYGHGVIGVAAQHRTPIRISHFTSEYAYARAIRASTEEQGLAAVLETEIPLPGLPEPRSQLAVPILAGKRLLGVIFAESPEDMRFRFDDEDALVALAAQLGLHMQILQQSAESAEPAPVSAPAPASRAGPPAVVSHYPENDSVFLDESYLIKGVAGAIFWKLLRDFVQRGRTEFSNRELRLDPSIRLPDISDNLEARLILLERRLAERCPFLRIEKTGRGRFRLRVERPLELRDVPVGAT